MQQISNLEGLGDIRAKLNSTRIYQQFETVADLIASTRPVPEGEYVGVPLLGHWYIGAASGASDHHLTNAFGSKLYVLPESAGVWHFGAWNPDMTDATDQKTLLQTVCDYVLTQGNNVTLKLPGGTLRLAGGGSVYVNLGRGQTITLQGTGTTTLHLVTTSLQPRARYSSGSEAYLTTDLSSAVDNTDMTATLDDVTGIQEGDMLRFICDEWVEDGWKYDKVDIRRVIKIDGNTVWLHKQFRWPHDPTDTNHRVEAYWPSYCNIDGIHFLTEAASGNGGPTVALRFLSGGKLTNGSLTGTTVGWTGSAFSDGPKLVSSMGVHCSWNLKNLRYAPMFTSAHACRFHDAHVEAIRHCDPNAWAEDCVVENVYGIRTQGLIQSHPNTGMIFRNVTDALDDSVLCGFDLRGLGETIEHCRSIGTVAIGAENTGQPQVLEEYLYCCLPFTRRISDYDAPRAIVTAGIDGQCKFERVRAYKIKSDGAEDYSRVFVDPDCIQTVNADLDFEANPKLHVIQTGPVHVPTVSRLKTDGSPQTITAITQASPAVVTIAGHGYSDDDVVWVYGGTMSQIENYYTVTNATTDTFQLTTLDGTVVDSTSYTAYTSGGLATLKAAVDAIDPNVYAGVGSAGKMHMIAKIASNEATTFTKEFLYRPFTEGSVSSSAFGRQLLITLKAATRDELSERKVHIAYRRDGPGTIPVTAVSQMDTDNTVLTIGLPTLTQHINASLMTAEGTSTTTANRWARHYLLFSVEVTAAQAVEWLTAEIEDWHPDMMDPAKFR